jgi:hypothetical protein
VVDACDALRVINTNDFVVGFKGYMAGDAAMVLAEWIPIYLTCSHLMWDTSPGR